MTLFPAFKSLEHYDRYKVVLRSLENEKQLFWELLTVRELMITEIHEHDGDYNSLNNAIKRLRAANARIKVTQKELERLTKKYYELLKYFTV